MVICLKIESYEPYHIGNKLNPATNFDTLRRKLRSKLESDGYQISQEEVQGFIPQNEVLGKKDDVRIELNNAAQALNVIGEMPEKVTSYYIELLSKLDELGFDIDDTFLFTEIIAVIVVKSDGIPTEVLQKIVKNDIEKISFKSINELDVIGIRLAKKDASDNPFVITIEPHPTSTNSRFQLRLQYREKNRQLVESFYKNLDEDIVNLINQMV
jgi:hypothetical protein